MMNESSNRVLTSDERRMGELHWLVVSIPCQAEMVPEGTNLMGPDGVYIVRYEESYAEALVAVNDLRASRPYNGGAIEEWTICPSRDVLVAKAYHCRTCIDEDGDPTTWLVTYRWPAMHAWPGVPLPDGWPTPYKCAECAAREAANAS